MLKFILYLIESGLCLSVLFVLYHLFFRKETYFTFNRYYLIGIIFLSLTIPLVHVNLRVKAHQKLEPTLVEIGKFRNYYERLIALSDPDFTTYYENGLPRAVFEGNWETFDRSDTRSLYATNLAIASLNDNGETAKRWSVLQWIVVIYAVGVGFFLVRFFVLVTALLWQLLKYPVVERLGIKIVLMPEEVPPFSFFRYVFIHEKVIDLPEFEKIMAHERVHIYQSHSIDLLIAQVLVIFQWYNPLVWQVQKAIKINNEFIADDTVVNSGFELFDYQTLLLSQLISIRSVELVNNFNLISIKKRITMMTKIKSGFQAKLKALVPIPATIALLFLFTNLTISSPTLRFSNYSPITFKMNQPALEGLWKSDDILAKYAMISIAKNTISILDNNTVRDYKVDFTTNYLQLQTGPNQELKLPIKTSGNLLTIWWTPEDPVKYRKTAFTNSLELFLSETHQKINLPAITHYQMLERQELVINVILGINYFEVDGVKGSINEFEQLITTAKSNRSALDRPLLVVNLNIDKNVPMKKVYQIYQVLRNNQMLKIAYAGYTSDHKVPVLLQHAAAIPKLLPPLEAEYITEDEQKELRAEDKLMDFSAVNKSADQNFISELKKRLAKTNKLIMVLQYDNNTPFGQYVSYTDATYIAMYSMRDDLAMSKYNIPYNDLPKSLQIDIRKQFPMMLTETNLDED